MGKLQALVVDNQEIVDLRKELVDMKVCFKVEIQAEKERVEGIKFCLQEEVNLACEQVVE